MSAVSDMMIERESDITRDWRMVAVETAARDAFHLSRKIRDMANLKGGIYWTIEAKGDLRRAINELSLAQAELEAKKHV